MGAVIGVRCVCDRCCEDKVLDSDDIIDGDGAIDFHELMVKCEWTRTTNPKLHKSALLCPNCTALYKNIEKAHAKAFKVFFETMG